MTTSKTWRERIEEAKERKARGEQPFTEEVIYLACTSWRMCKVGEERERLGEDIIQFECSGPVDSILRWLGGPFAHGFGWAVGHQNVDLAEQRLNEIEGRCDQLKQEHVLR